MVELKRRMEVRSGSSIKVEEINNPLIIDFDILTQLSLYEILIIFWPDLLYLYNKEHQLSAHIFGRLSIGLSVVFILLLTIRG